MKSKKQKSSSTYSERFKIKVMHKVLNGTFSKEEARKLFNIKGNSTILNWMRSYNLAGENSLLDQDKKSLSAMEKDIELQNSLAQIKDLENRLNAAELEASLYKRMIDIAKERYGFEIKKKLRSETICEEKVSDEQVVIQQACLILCFTKQAYYKALKRKEKRCFEEAIIIEMVKQLRSGVWKKGTGRKVLDLLKSALLEHNIKIGRDRFFDLLRANNLLVSRRKVKPYTTNSLHHYRKYPNLIKDLKVTKMNQLWVSDMTYIWLSKSARFSYLFLITDVYSRKIIGYCLSLRPNAEAAIQALSQAVEQAEARGDDLSLCYHHSDRGVQYCCHDYTGILNDKKIQISMTENSDPRENAIAERVIGIIKSEFTNDKEFTFTTFKQGRQEIKEIIKFYNEVRPHNSIEGMTPEQASKCTGELKRYWKSYYRKRKT